MGQRSKHKVSPVIEFAGWVLSVAWRPGVALVDLVAWFAIALMDAFERRTRWFRRRLASRWRWQFSVAVGMAACLALTVVSLR